MYDGRKRSAEERAERAEGEWEASAGARHSRLQGQKRKSAKPHTRLLRLPVLRPSDALLACQLGKAGFGRSQWTKEDGGS